MKIGSYELRVPYVTTAADSMKAILELADTSQKDTVVDLGSGNGRVILEFAKHDIHAVGFEIKPDLVALTQQKAKELGLDSKITVTTQSFWDADLSSFSIIYIYGMSTIMGRLEAKLQTELKPGTKVLSNIFRFPNWKIKKTKNNIHLYIIQ